MPSFVKQCQKIGVTYSNQGQISMSEFSCVLPSVRRTLEAMSSPKPSHWKMSSEFKENRFLESLQGVAHDGQFWYITANGNGERKSQGIFKYDQQMNLIKSLKISHNIALRHIYSSSNPDTLPFFDHIGDLDCFNDQLYIPIQHPHGFLVVNTDLNASSAKWFKEENRNGDTHAWCAVNPWNNKLYTSDFMTQNIDKGQDDYRLTLYAYDVNTLKRLNSFDMDLKVPSLRVQGGCYSNDGHLYLSSDAYTYSQMLSKIAIKISDPISKAGYIQKLNILNQSSIPLEPCITMYSFINGHLYGKVPVQRESEIFFKQELEGITYWPKIENRQLTKIHLLLLENQLGKDGVHFKHFRSTNN
tara:strand:+ start:5247 stop:6320 length:1074 start_codon:yes stop_codon:yes gene_type:complete